MVAGSTGDRWSHSGPTEDRLSGGVSRPWSAKVISPPLDLPLDRLDLKPIPPAAFLSLMGARTDEGHDQEEREGNQEIEDATRSEADSFGCQRRGPAGPPRRPAV